MPILVSVLIPVVRFVYNIDKGFCARFHIRKRTACHAAGTIQYQNDIGRIRSDIGGGGEKSGKSKSDFQRSVAVYAVHVYLFV